LDSDEEISQEKPPGMWVKEIFMKEQSEEYDSEEDPEYVPPSIIYETDKEYDEYSDGGDVIPKEEVAVLLDEKKKHLVPPSTYIPIWIPVPSPAEKIARAKEQVENKKEESKSETSGKDTDSNGKRVLETPAKEIEKVVGAPAPLIEELTGEAVETGLTPIMKKLNVDGKPPVKEIMSEKVKSMESSEGPKPKRERKKSKSKGESGGDTASSAEVAAASNEVKGDEESVTENEVNDRPEKESEVSVKSPEAGTAVVPDCSVKVSEKSKAVEKSKKSPSKKSPVKAGQEILEK